jgi:hypothetical protein
VLLDPPSPSPSPVATLGPQPIASTASAIPGQRIATSLTETGLHIASAQAPMPSGVVGTCVQLG